MIRTLIRALGRLALLFAAMLFISAISIFVLGSFLLTFPILRLSPRERRMRSIIDFASAGMGVAAVFSEQQFRKTLKDITDAALTDDENEKSDGRVDFPPDIEPVDADVIE